MTLWGAAVLAFGGEPRAVLTVQPADADEYDRIRVRLARADFKRVSRAEFTRGVWPRASATTHVYLAGQVLSHLHTGQSRLQPAPALVMTGAWLTAARLSGQVLVVLVPPGAFDPVDDGTDRLLDGPGLGRAVGLVEDLAAKRLLIAGVARATEIPH